MTTDDRPRVITAYQDAPTRTVSAGGVTYAYGELGPKGGVPVVFPRPPGRDAGQLGPRIIDPIAQTHHVITFDNRGVGASSGTVPGTVEAMADDAATFIGALGFAQVDIFSFALGGINRNAEGRPAAKAFVDRLQERTVDRDVDITTTAFLTQLKAIKRWVARPPRTCRGSRSPP